MKSELFFLDLSKAFDKVWHKGLIHELKQKGISGNILNTINDFLSFRKQRIVTCFKWASFSMGPYSDQ